MTTENEVNYNVGSGITEGGITLAQPKMAKGGVFAIADIELIKNALVFYAKHNGNVTEAEERQAVNLLHRLNNRT